MANGSLTSPSTCFALNLLQIASLLFKPLNAKKVYAFNGRLAGIMWYLMQRVVEVQNGTKITFSGADIPVQESAIIIANHKSYADFYLIHALAARRRMLFNCKVGVVLLQGAGGIITLQVYGQGFFEICNLFMVNN